MLLSIDAGSSIINIVEGEAKKGGVFVKRAAMVQTPPASIQDGNLSELSSIADAIRSAMNASGMTSNRVIFTVGSTEILHRELTIPRGDPKKLAPIVHNEMYQHLTGTEPYAVDYLPSDELVEDNPLMQRVYASGMPRRMAAQYHTLTGMLKLKPASLQMHPSAVTKLIKNATVNDTAIAGKSVILCDIGMSTMHLYLFSSNKMVFSRCIKNTYPDFVKNMLMLDGFDTPAQVTERADLSPEALAANPRVSYASMMFLSALSEEIQRLIQFSLSRRLKTPIEAVYLCGGVSNIHGLAASLTASLELPVEGIDRLSTVHGAFSGSTAEYINAIAAIAEP